MTALTRIRTLDTTHKQLDDFDFDLPEHLIAHYPLEKRSTSRLLCVDKKGALTDNRFNMLNRFLNAGDLLILNDSKVIRARLYGVKSSGGKVQILLERLIDSHRALARIKASKAPHNGTSIYIGESCEVTIVDRSGEFFEICSTTLEWSELLEKYGTMPLPPYIKRSAEDLDDTRYQTVYAKHSGSVAAPTAGLHFDQDLLNKLQDNGVIIKNLTLHIGSGTYQPIRENDLSHHHMHQEYFQVSQDLCTAIEECRRNKKRIVAVGTTTVRALEALAINGLRPAKTSTDIFISPGFNFQIVDAMITNFHLPRTTLFILVCAFGGYQTMHNAYHYAIENTYRFFSYGDSMLIERHSE